MKPEWNRDEIEKAVVPILKEYFEHCQASEVIVSVSTFVIYKIVL